MEFLSITIANLIWIFYSMLEGVRESSFDHYKDLNKRCCLLKTKSIFITQRVLVLILTMIVMSKTIGIMSIPVSIGQIFMFQYFHKLLYNITKKNLNKDKLEINLNKKDYILEKNKYLLTLGIILQLIIYFTL
jgi:hypothetical protein